MARGTQLQPWKVLQSTEVFSADPWVKISVHQVQLPDGKVVPDYYQVGLPEFTVIYAETIGGKVIVERLYKHGIGKITLTLPAGSIAEGEDPLANAKRELMEETGYRAEDWRPLGSFVINGNYGCGKAHLFTADRAVQVAEPDSGDLEDMEILLLTPAELLAQLWDGGIDSLSTVAAIFLSTNSNKIQSERHGDLG